MIEFAGDISASLIRRSLPSQSLPHLLGFYRRYGPSWLVDDAVNLEPLETHRNVLVLSGNMPIRKPG